MEKLKTNPGERHERAPVERCQDKQLCYEQKFDIISHKSHLPVTEKSLAETLRDRPKYGLARDLQHQPPPKAAHPG